VLATAACAWAWAPGLAEAALVQSSGGNRLLFSGATGEVNNVTVSLNGGTYTFTETPPVSITPVAPCVQGQTSNVATCPAAGVVEVETDLFDQNDTVLINAPTRALVFAGSGNDTVTGGTGNDELVGDSNAFGDDTLRGGGGDDELFGDTAAVASSSGGTNSLDGGPGRDFVTGGGGVDTVRGGADGDRLFGYGDVDDLDGEGGDDLVVGGDAADTLRGGDGHDQLGEPAGTAGGFGPDRGSDVFDGGPGDDLLRPGLGPTQGIPDDDRLNGGGGFDSVTYEQRNTVVTASMDGSPNDGSSGESDNIALDVERLVGGKAGDLLSGGPNHDTIDGLTGADTITGGPGNDALDGGVADAESDSVSGGPGDDGVRGNAGDDSLSGEEGRDAVQGGGGDDSLFGGADQDVLEGGPGADRVAGGAGDDQVDGSTPALVGLDGADTLRGDAGNDSLSGGDAGDTLTGGTGADAMSGGPGRDTADNSEAIGNVTVTLDGRANDGELEERDNVRPDVEDLRGGGVQDTYTGSGIRNELDGGAGEDFVDGRKGSDSLRGGASRDVVRARDGTRDVVDCGRSPDFAIVDRKDVVRNCERRAVGRGRTRLGRDVVVRPKGRGAEFGLPRTRRTVPLLDNIALPVATSVDTRRGSVRLTAARTRRRNQSATFSAGAFTVLQARSRRPVTELRLKGGNFALCAAGARASGAPARASRRRVRRLRASGRGRFRTRGRHSAATVRGTDYTVIDRCDGTLTTVRRGVVRVRDFRLRRTVTVWAGQRYLARARRR